MSKQAKPKVRTLADLGFSPEQMAGLANQAQSMYEPDAFDQEVQKHLDALHGIPEDSALSEQDQEGQHRIAQQESLDNLSVPQSPVIPAPKQAKQALPAKTPPWETLGS